MDHHYARNLTVISTELRKISWKIILAECNMQSKQQEIQEEVESVNDNEELEGFDMGCDAAEFDTDFDPMQALGQLLVTHDGETIPDVLTGIRHSLETLTKVLHKISKSLDTKK